VQGWLRLSPAWRHWRNASWLRERGVAAGEPLAIVRGRSGGVAVECLAVEFIAGRTVLEHAAAGDLSTRAEHRVAAAVAALACGLAREGRVNRDAKPSNLVVMRADAAAAELAVLDCADLRRCRPGDRAALVRMLASAVIEPTGCGLRMRGALRMRAVRSAAAVAGSAPRRAAVRALWREIAAAVEAHGDPAPRDNPLP
jgi:hypothetical protein